MKTLYDKDSKITLTTSSDPASVNITIKRNDDWNGKFDDKIDHSKKYPTKAQAKLN